jgi:hypothetical protein
MRQFNPHPAALDLITAAMDDDAGAAQAVIEKLTHDELLIVVNTIAMWFADVLEEPAALARFDQMFRPNE